MVASEFPESSHAELIGKRGCSDAWLWNYAKPNDLVIVSKDTDFRQRAVIAGPAPIESCKDAQQKTVMLNEVHLLFTRKAELNAAYPYRVLSPAGRRKAITSFTYQY